MQANTKDLEKKKILDESKIIAVVGLSDKPGRTSNHIAGYLQSHGYIIVPVNPNVEKILGEKAYPDLESIPFKVDMVDIFRRSEEVHDIVKSAQEKDIPAVWVQPGIRCSAETMQLALDNNMKFVKDCCIMVEHSVLCG